MSSYHTYIQQYSYDGTTYKKGKLIDTIADYNIGCVSFPFDLAAKTKKIPSRDWNDEDGGDPFIPPMGLLLDSYELEVEFFYKGAVDKIASDMQNFLDFIRGRNKGAVGAYLMVYDEHAQYGRKGVVVNEVEPDMFQADDSDPDAMFDFKVKFQVYDPATQVTPSKDSNGKVTELTFSTSTSA